MLSLIGLNHMIFIGNEVDPYFSSFGVLSKGMAVLFYSPNNDRTINQYRK